MAKQSTKIKIVAEGAKVIQKKGFNNTGIIDVLNAAGVPKGSFYFYFKSKEDFGIEVINYLAENVRRAWTQSPKYTTESPLESLKRRFDEATTYFQHAGCIGGCPIGNLAQEMGDLNDVFRQRLQEIFLEMRNVIAQSIREAQRLSEINRSFDAEQLADFILNSWEGALLRMKTEKSVIPLLNFNQVIFDILFKR
ncbi:MAG: TetR family transcriptional regulator C-terminal domain-containing protein [Desulfomonilaceae bacterium]